MCGESAAVNSESVEDWKKRLPEIIKGYHPRDIFNMDETGLFYRALPDKSLSVKGSACSKGQHSKERISVMLCVSMTREFEKALVIGKSERPRCFKNISTKNLPVKWVANRRAWMTSSIFTEWVRRFDRRMALAGRKILLFLDNATCHPRRDDLTNVKLVFLPPNATSVLQPLDQGIIQTMKIFYRRQLLQSIIRRAEMCTDVSELKGKITVLDAIYYISNAVKEIKSTTVQRCFEKCGFSCNSQAPGEETTVDYNCLESLIGQLPLTAPMSAAEYLLVDQDIPCIEEPTASTEILNESATFPSKDDSSDEEVVSFPACDPPRFSDVISSVMLIREYALHHNLPDILQQTVALEQSLSVQHSQLHVVQTKMSDFFSSCTRNTNSSK